MEATDFRLLEAALLDDWRSALAEFSASSDNVRVYALAVHFHPEYAPPSLCLNTERGFQQIVARYPGKSLESMRHFGGARWIPADFLYVDIAPMSEATKRLSTRYEAQLEESSDEAAHAQVNLLADTLVSAVSTLGGSLDALDRTPDFVAYVWPSDADDSELISFTRRTVPPPLFERLFPEVLATEAFMANIARRPTAEQARFWADALRDLLLDAPSASADMLRTLGRTQYDATRALLHLGGPAIPELVRLAEENALAEEWNERDSDDWKRRGASTRRGELAASALASLETLEGGSDEIIERLQALLQRLHERDRGRRLAGVNGQLTARALHALRPRRFPKAQFSDKTNHLLNFEDYRVGM